MGEQKVAAVVAATTLCHDSKSVCAKLCSLKVLSASPARLTLLCLDKAIAPVP